MKKQHIQRIVGYALLVAALLLLPTTLLNTEGRLPNLGNFLVFTLMVAAAVAGYVLVDSAGSTLEKMGRHEQS